MPSLIVTQPEGDTWWQVLAHNRLNFDWQMSKHLRVNAGMRNRLITGSAAMLNPKSIGSDLGWADLSWNWAEGKNVVGNTAFDRLNLTFEKDKWKFQLGRQRINWGQTFVWNANDLFNTYSFFDFDYPERPGCDAFRGTYYHSATSLSELAVSFNHNGKITVASLHRWNRNGADYQIIAGEQAETDLVIGGAITKDFSGLNLRSEMSYFHPIKNMADTSGIVAISVGADHIFSNSLMLQAEILYNNVGKGGGLMDIYTAPLSAKRMSICDWNIFASATYPLTPRLSGTLSSMYFIDIKCCYTGLSLDYSIITNLDFSFVTQYFSTFGNSSAGNMQMFLGFVRVKYSFGLGT
jgi:hypothetical protein